MRPFGWWGERLERGHAASKALVEQAARALDGADAVVIGAGAGLSAAAGFAYTGPRFRRWFGDFQDTYGFSDMYAGGFYPFETEERRWGYWARYIMANRYDTGPSATYGQLLDLVRERDYFVLTTNVDHQFQLAGFDKRRLFYTQGDYGLFQCARPCCARTWDNEEVVRAMMAAEEDAWRAGRPAMDVPSELLPRCPHCGAPAAMNLRADETFVEDEGWHVAAERYRGFLRRHRGVRVLYWELGVGFNTPGIVKFPFWSMTAESERADYLCVNRGEAVAPTSLAGQSVLIDDDIAKVIGLLHGRQASGKAA